MCNKHKFSKLRGRMAELQMTQEEFSKMFFGANGNSAASNRMALSQMLSGTRQWKLDDMWKAMELLDIPYDQMHIYFPYQGVAAC